LANVKEESAASLLALGKRKAGEAAGLVGVRATGPGLTDSQAGASETLL
jgi:hypothetical protein